MFAFIRLQFLQLSLAYELNEASFQDREHHSWSQ